MDTAVLAFFKQENVLYIKWILSKNPIHLSENLIAKFQSLLKNIALLSADSSADSFTEKL